MSKVTEIIKALKQFKKSFDLTDPDDFGDVSRRFATQFTPEELVDAGKKATGRDKAFFARATSDAKQYQMHKKDVEKLGFNKGGVKTEGSTRGPTDRQIKSMLKAGKIDNDEANGLLEFNRKMRQKNQSIPRKKPKPPTRTQMMKGGMYNKKPHSYTGGGMVKDMKIMRSK